MIVESHIVDVELQSQAKWESRNIELLDNEPEIDFQDLSIQEERRTKPRLSKYVKRHHLAKKVIRMRDARPMTRNRMRSDTCLLSMHEPKIVKDVIDNEY